MVVVWLRRVFLFARLHPGSCDIDRNTFLCFYLRIICSARSSNCPSCIGFFSYCLIVCFAFRLFLFSGMSIRCAEFHQKLLPAQVCLTWIVRSYRSSSDLIRWFLFFVFLFTLTLLGPGPSEAFPTYTAPRPISGVMLPLRHVHVSVARHRIMVKRSNKIP